MNTSHALSLLDGPCGLTCDVFYDELFDQASDHARVSRVSLPYLAIYAHPESSLPSNVRWPVAAVPRNGAHKRSAQSYLDQIAEDAKEDAKEFNERRQPYFANIAKVVACTEARMVLHGSPAVSPEQNESLTATATSVKGRRGSSDTPKKRKCRSNSHRKQRSESSGPAPANSVPGNIDQLSALFSGGLIHKVQVR